MARYTGSVCRLCRREGEKLFLKGDALLYEEVRLRAAADAARPARRPPPQGRRVRPAAAREAEGPRPTASSSASSATTSRGREPPRRDRREPAPLARAAPGQRRLPDGLRAVARRRPASSSTHGHFAVNGVPTEHPVLPAQAGRQIEVREIAPRPRAVQGGQGDAPQPPGAGVAGHRCRQPRPAPSSRRPAATRCRSTSTSSSWSSTTRGNRPS